MSAHSFLTRVFPFARNAGEKAAFLESFHATSGTMAGILAWGMVTGMAMAKSGMTVWQALGMTFIVFAGSAQLAALPLIAAGVPVWIVFVTALIVNLRFVIFSAAVGPHFRHLPLRSRIWHGYLIGDIVMAFFPQRYPHGTEHQPAGKLGFYSGIIYPNWIAWQTGSVLGILLAAQIPDTWGIGFAGTLALLAILVPSTVNMAALGGVIVAGTVAVLAHGWPYRLGLLAAVVAGMTVAMAIDTLLPQDQEGDIDE